MSEEVTRKIVDTNFLQSPELRAYLKKSPNNFAVLTDYASMEAYKADGLTAIFRSMEILSAFPRQVVILKNTIHVCGLEPTDSDIPLCLIDQEQTGSFGKFCLDLALAKSGSQKMLDSLKDHQRVAREHMKKIEADVPQLLLGFKGIQETYSNEEIRALRTEGRYLDGLVIKVVKNAMTLAAVFFKNHPEVKSFPDFESLHNRFIFRLSVCTQILLLRWIEKGSQTKIKEEKLRNDVVDLNYAAFALYFDGLLTNDKKLLSVYEEASVAITSFSHE